MKKYTANYTYTNPNFVIQNLLTNQTNGDLLPILYVIKNILQRGFPTTLSKYLQSELGEIHKLDNFEERFLFATNQTVIWKDTIKGDKDNNYYPAKDFFERIIPNEFGEYSFIQSLLIPEIQINDIISEEDENFINQQVDFYLPPAKLVIEIDGQQHKLDEVTRTSDSKRNIYLSSKGVTTIRIDTKEFQNGSYKVKVEQILKHLEQYEKLLAFYKNACEKIEENQMSEVEIKTKLLPTAIIRFQILLIELLTHNYLTFKEDWNLNVFISNPSELEIFENISYREEIYGLVQDCGKNALELAINDLLIWIDKLWQLKNKQELKKPSFNIVITNNKNQFQPTTKAVNIDFSLFKRYTDENKFNEDVIFVRTDYFDIVKDKNYFRVSTTEPINYNVTDEDKPILEFFLDNIFDKQHFREGQFPIISNTLNRKDTIGLLPTGGGKSLCYQLPCLLQPSINFVVCPIKSLMYDQNDNLVKTLITNVSFITSDLEADERREIERNFEQGRYLFVWISPEKLQIPTFREKISSIVANFSIAYAVVDEVHCLSEWGHDFRTSYLNLAKTIDKLSPKDENGEGKIKFIGLTATASVNVLKDIKIEFSRQKQHLEDENIKSLLDYSRNELQFEVINDNGNKYEILKSILSELKETEDFTETEEKAGLVFTPNVNGNYGCFPLSNKINTVFYKKASWFSGEVPKIKSKTFIEAVHIANPAFLENEIELTLKNEGLGNELTKLIISNKLYEIKATKNPKWFQLIIGKDSPIMGKDKFNKYKLQVQKDFKENRYQLLVATKAFGMGIDKQNIFYTFHYGLPSSVEALYQEAGRAGRWDKQKEENKSKIGKCYVLHSHETHDYLRVERLFHKNTTFTEMKEISEEVKWDGKDIFQQVHLFIQGQNDIEKDFEIIKSIIKIYFKENQRKKIFWNANRFIPELGIKEDVLEKAIYRLSLLGIISDWTTNFINHFEVHFNTLNENHIIKYVSDYITKYEPNTDLKSELQKVPQNTILEKAIWYLLNWIFENISYSRKQSLKTLSDWCSKFQENGGSDEFKRRIDNYFIFTDTTFILQDIAENPNKYENWFEALYKTDEYEENGIKKKNKIHIPEIDNIEEKKREYEKLRDSISRFLESYRNNIGLNFLSGFVRLTLNEFDDNDGKERFESAISIIKGTFANEEQNDFLFRLKIIGKHLTEEQKMELSQIVSRYYPEMLEEFAEYYDLAYLLNDVYAEKLKKLKKLNRKLYEQLAEI